MNGMLLYRGLSQKYKRDEVGQHHPGPFLATDFTDCPFAALQYARGTNGMLLVLEIPAEAMAGGNSRSLRVSKELWFPNGAGPQRYMVWGRFDEFLRAEIPAKILRAETRKKGVLGQPDQVKSTLLRKLIEEYIHD